MCLQLPLKQKIDLGVEIFCVRIRRWRGKRRNSNNEWFHKHDKTTLVQFVLSELA